MNAMAALVSAWNSPRSAWLLALSVTGLALIVASGLGFSRRLFVWNASASVPVGLYVRQARDDLKRGDLVLLWLPDSARTLASERRYLPHDVPALKPIAALAGDTVCAEGQSLTINGQATAKRLTEDRQGRSLLLWNGCQRLMADDVFVLSTHAPDSFDGRYFGPVKARQIIEKVAPIFTF